jgi:hypothetical protein
MLVCKHVAFLACWQTGLHNYNWTCCRIISIRVHFVDLEWLEWQSQTHHDNSQPDGVMQMLGVHGAHTGKKWRPSGSQFCVSPAKFLGHPNLWKLSHAQGPWLCPCCAACALALTGSESPEMSSIGSWDRPGLFWHRHAVPCPATDSVTGNWPDLLIFNEPKV